MCVPRTYHGHVASLRGSWCSRTRCTVVAAHMTLGDLPTRARQLSARRARVKPSLPAHAGHLATLWLKWLAMATHGLSVAAARTADAARASSRRTGDVLGLRLFLVQRVVRWTVGWVEGSSIPPTFLFFFAFAEIQQTQSAHDKASEGLHVRGLTSFWMDKELHVRARTTNGHGHKARCSSHSPPLSPICKRPFPYVVSSDPLSESVSVVCSPP